MVGLRLVFAVVLVGMLAACPPASGVLASDQWCDNDPPVVIRTPGGALVTVYVTNGALGVQHLPAVELASIATDVSPAGGGTRVRMRVLVPDDPFASGFPTRTVVSTGPFATGTIHARASGSSGQPMAMTFTLPLA